MHLTCLAKLKRELDLAGGGQADDDLKPKPYSLTASVSSSGPQLYFALAGRCGGRQRSRKQRQKNHQVSPGGSTAEGAQSVLMCC